MPGSVEAREDAKIQEVGLDETAVVQVDRSRRLLGSQHSHAMEDPLEWPLWIKVGTLLQVALLGALGTLNAAIINPAYVPLSKEFGITVVQASYQTTVVIAVSGIGPFIWVPLANVYGRRPVYIFTTLLGFCSALGCAFVHGYPQLIVARVLNGFFPAANSIGASTVADLFFYHQRGRAMGVFTVIMMNGTHLAPIIGGLLGQFLGWRWCFKFAAICNAFMLILIFFCLPETLYFRQTPACDPDKPTKLQYPADAERAPPLTAASYWDNVLPRKRNPAHPFRLEDVVLPTIRIARHPSVLFPAIYYGVQNAFAGILPAVTVAGIFSERFGFSVLQIGLASGAALTIGASLGELAAGQVADAVIKREHRRATGEIEPEARLKTIWHGELLVPVMTFPSVSCSLHCAHLSSCLRWAGLLIYGFCIQTDAHWSGSLMGMGIACFGLQVITTTCYTYSVDCFRSQAGDVSQVFNFIRQEFGMTVAFYAINLGHGIGFQFEALLFALIGSGVCFVPIVALMFWGARWREKGW